MLQQLQLQLPPWRQHSSRLSTLSHWATGSAASPTGGSSSRWGEHWGSCLVSLPASACCKPDCPGEGAFCVQQKEVGCTSPGRSPPAAVSRLAGAEPRDTTLSTTALPVRDAFPALPIRDTVKTDPLQQQEPPSQASSAHVSVRVKASTKEDKSDGKPFYSLITLTTSGTAAC